MFGLIYFFKGRLQHKYKFGLKVISFYADIGGKNHRNLSGTNFVISLHLILPLLTPHPYTPSTSSCHSLHHLLGSQVIIMNAAHIRYLAIKRQLQLFYRYIFIKWATSPWQQKSFFIKPGLPCPHPLHLSCS